VLAQNPIENPLDYKNKGEDRIIKEDSSLVKNDTIEDTELTFEERFSLIEFRQDKVFNDFHSVDTSLNFFADAPSYFYNRPFLYRLSTFGSPVHDLVWSDRETSSFSLGLDQYDEVNFTYDDMKLYRAGAPFTELHWRFGSERLEHLVAEHGQVINDRFFLGAKYQRSSSRGFYQRQKSGSNNAYAYMMYQSKNRRYKTRLELIHNGYTSQENGGTLDLNTDTATIFSLSNIGRREVIWIRLAEAKSSFKSTEYGFTHFYDVGDDVRISKNDTIDYLRLVPTWRIQHRLSYKDDYFLYSDDSPNSSYDELLLDESVIRDYIHYYRWQNQLDLIYNGASVFDDSIRYMPFRFSIGLESGQHHIEQIFERNRDLNSLDIKFRVEKNPNHISRINAIVKGKIGIAGFNAGTYNAIAKVGYPFDSKETELSASIQSRSQEPSFISERYYANVHQWDRQLPRYMSNSLGLHIKSEKYSSSIDVYYHQLKNYHTWDSVFDPYLVSTGLFQSNISSILPLGKFRIKNNLSIQLTDEEALAIPTFAGHHWFYFEGKMFKGALNGQAGIDLSYNTSFKPLSYEPTIGQYYYNPESDLTRGFTPLLGAFISFKVRSVLLMGRAEFINQGLGYLGDLEIPALGTEGYFLHPRF